MGLNLRKIKVFKCFDRILCSVFVEAHTIYLTNSLAIYSCKDELPCFQVFLSIDAPVMPLNIARIYGASKAQT